MSDELARQLREAGRDDLADQLERGTGQVPTDDPPADPNEAFLQQIQSRMSGQWVHTPAFGGISEDQEAALVSAALDRDVPGWRG